MDRPEGQILTGIDSGLAEGSQSVLLDIDPEISLDFLKAAAKFAGKRPPKRASREQLEKTHNEHLKSLVRNETTPRTVKKIILSLAYSPSSKSIRELEKILLNELLVEEHHEGKILVVRTTTAPYCGAATVTIVEDETGYAEKLVIYNQWDASIMSSIPAGSLVAIKEPYFKLDGRDDFIICVDHPSDIVWLEPTDSIVPSKFRTNSGREVAKTPTQWVAEGDNAFIGRKFPEAIRYYSRALDLITAGEEAMAAKVLAKRANTNLVLTCFDSALADALASRNGSPADWKACLVAAKAAYGLTKYRESLRYVEMGLEQNFEALALKKEYQRCLARIREEEDGGYDLSAMAEQVSRQQIHMDYASFLAKTKVASSPHHGRGLFATRDIEAGELVFCEKAACLPNQYNVEHNGAALYVTMVERCTNNPSIYSKMLDLHGGNYKRTGFEGKVIDGMPVVDVFLLESIRRTNCFMSPHCSAKAASPSWTIEHDGMARGTWWHAAYANHSCWPNSNRSFIGDMLVSTATKNIKAGDEITHLYLPPKAVYTAREDQFSEWGFNCGCRLCAVEAKSPKRNHEKRREVLLELETLISKNNKSRKLIQQSTIRTIEKLVKRLEELHEPEVYEDIPRLMLSASTVWLTDAYQSLKNHTKTVKWAAQVLRNFGFCAVSKDGNWNVYSTSPAGISTFEVVKALRHAQAAYAALGDGRLSNQCAASAKLGWRTMIGFDSEIQDTL